MNNNTGAIILAAGKGSRMKSVDKNKVTIHLGNKPIVLRIVHLLQQLHLQTIVAVVGFAKESVMEVLAGENVVFAEQKEQMGTGHATEVGLEKMPEDIADVIVLYGDDASLYPISLLQNIVDQHQSHKPAVTMLTITVVDPKGLGRVIRDGENNVIGIVEEKNATEEQRRINEINPGFYIFNRNFLQTYLPLIEKNSVSGEYYLTDIIELALKNNETVETVEGKDLPWRGINTPEELQAAEQQIVI